MEYAYRKGETVVVIERFFSLQVKGSYGTKYRTPDKGELFIVVKGARKRPSQFGGVVELLDQSGVTYTSTFQWVENHCKKV